MLRDFFIAVDPAIVIAIGGLLATTPLFVRRFRKAESPSLRKRLIVQAILISGAVFMTWHYVARHGEWPMPLSLFLG